MNNKWQVKVYTSDLKDKRFEGTNAKVYISLIDDKDNETEKVLLDKNNVITNNKDLFEAGQMDEFFFRTKTGLKSLKKIRIGHDNSSLNAGWHLHKVIFVISNFYPATITFYLKKKTPNN